MFVNRILVFILTAFFALSAQAQSRKLSDYRWTSVETTGEATERHENAFIEYKGN